MATHFHTLIVSASPVTASKSATGTKPKRVKMNLDQELECQNAYMAYHLVYFLLKEYGVKLNGYANGACGGQHHVQPSRPCLRDPKFQEAFELLKSACLLLKEQYGEEFMANVGTLDVRDEQLYGIFHKVLSTMIEGELRWGRVTALFLFTAALGNRLHREAQQEKIVCLIGWLGLFLNRNLSEWISRQGGWVSTVYQYFTCLLSKVL